MGDLLMADADDHRYTRRALSYFYGGRHRCARVTAGWLMFIISTSRRFDGRVREQLPGNRSGCKVAFKPLHLRHYGRLI